MLQQESLPRAYRFETREGLIQLGDALQFVRNQQRLIQLQGSLAPAALRCRSGAGTVDEQIPHDLRRKRQKMGAVRQVEARSVNQADVRLMNQPGGVQRVLSWCAAQPPVRQLAQTFVDQGNKLISRVLVSRAPSLQETCDLRWDGRTALRRWDSQHRRSPNIWQAACEPFRSAIPFHQTTGRTVPNNGRQAGRHHTMLRDSISRGLVALCAGLLIAGCDQTTAPAPGQDPGVLRPLGAHNVGASTPALVASGLQGSEGSAIGPRGALFVAEGVAGRISRVDPQSGVVTTFASGLPASLFGIGGGGVVDVAFIGKTAYALVTGVGSDVGGSDVVGIYRVDGPTSFTVIADIGEFSMLNPPTTPFDVPTGFQYALEPYRGGFLVTDGHHNRVLRVTLDGDVTEVIQFANIVPTGLAVSGNTVYLALAGPVPHLPQDGKVVSFGPKSRTATEVASGARLLVDVEFGRGRGLYALSQGVFPVGSEPGSPALPNTGALVEVNRDGTFTVVTEGLNQPTSLEFIGNTAYVVTLAGQIWKIDNVSRPPYGVSR